MSNGTVITSDDKRAAQLPAAVNLARMSIRVAVVEDDARFRAAFAAAIEGSTDLSLQAQAPTLQEGLALLAGTAPDVLLVDLGLPDGSGIDLIKAARVAWPSCDIMVSSVFGDESHVLLSIEAGAVGYLLKDSEPERIVEQIRSLRAGAARSVRSSRARFSRVCGRQPRPQRRLRYPRARRKCSTTSPRDSATTTSCACCRCRDRLC